MDGGTFITQAEQQVDFDEFENEDVCQATLLHRKREEMKEVDKNLAKTKQECSRIFARVAKGEEAFKKKQEHFHKQIQQFQKFILDSDRKYTAKLKMADDEKKQAIKLGNMVLEKKDELSSLTVQKESLKNALNKLNRYQAFLLEVVRNLSAQFTFVDEILQRFQVLDQANAQLKETDREKKEFINAYTKDVFAEIKDKQNALLVKNSDLARCLKQLDDARSLVQHYTDSISQWYQKSQNLQKTGSTVQSAIHNLYRRSYQSFAFKKPTYKGESTEDKSFLETVEHYNAMLDEIGFRLLDLIDIAERFKE